MNRARLAAPLLFALLTACSILPKAETPKVYTLPAAPGARPVAGDALTGRRLRAASGERSSPASVGVGSTRERLHVHPLRL